MGMGIGFCVRWTTVGGSVVAMQMCWMQQSMGRSASKKCFSSNADVKPNQIKNISKKCFSSNA